MFSLHPRRPGADGLPERHSVADLLLRTLPGRAVFALAAGVLWGAYILLGVRVGKAYTGPTGLVLAMGVGACVALPLGVGSAGSSLLDPALLAAGFGVAVLSSAIPTNVDPRTSEKGALDLHACPDCGEVPLETLGPHRSFLPSCRSRLRRAAGSTCLSVQLPAREIDAKALSSMRRSASCRASYVHATRLPFDPGSPAADVHVRGTTSSWRGFGAGASRVG